MFLFLASVLSWVHPVAPPQYSHDWQYLPPPPPVVVVHKGYPESITRWKPLAMEAGWTAKQWPVLECLMAHESGGYPTAGAGKHDHVGLLQLSQSGFPDADLTDPLTNLTLAKGLYNAHWWAPWMMQGGDKCIPK